MAEFSPSENGYILRVDEKYYNTLDIEGFSQMMKDPSYCYKVYWLEAIEYSGGYFTACPVTGNRI